ncbi:tetratricopeptide repeat protein [Psychrosphaera sp. B3R10]|uniref:tetratricopeptide repeat protein n=1 Tax=unclassified Psychrosphaera TaxID=2641570 RepID=UPI001C093B72|nr:MULTISPECIES: tetratricopeptide repeat protein [unclassified Psychrosphaera]MBU2881009.1 tetratricopeptide repeat protein [Psychrosphaera sp. I2R16]MBU2989933.1 tetratricopeptide repeat protein [Psychrosphaera sp. B3R10]
MLKRLASIFFFVYSINIFAVEINTLNPIEKLVIDAPILQQTMYFNVTLPASYYSALDKKYVVIFDLHPRSQPYLSGMHDWLSHNSEWPWLESIVVTPATYHPGYAKLFEDTAAEPTNMVLLDLYEQHILPKLDDTFRTNGFKVYSGFMSNGAFGLYTMLNKPNLFNAYLISSPTLSNDFLNIVADAKSKLPLLKNKNLFLYLTIGKHQYEQAHVQYVEELAEILEKYAPEGLDWEVKSDDPHYYMSRPVLTVLNGIEKLFDDYHNDLSADSSISQQGIDAIVNYYAELSNKKYGFTVSAEGSLNKLAAAQLTRDKSKAVQTYLKIITLYPNSAYAYSNYAAALAQTGQLKAAIEQQKIAVEKSKSLGKWHQNKHAKLLDKYQKRNRAVAD